MNIKATFLVLFVFNSEIFSVLFIVTPCLASNIVYYFTKINNLCYCIDIYAGNNTGAYKVKKKTLLIDLDGVLNEYTGIYDDDVIPPPRAGARDFIAELSKSYNIKLFTCRNKLLASKWLVNNNLDSYIKDITAVKEPCWLYIDDRCINFNGNFNELACSIADFEPWYKEKAPYGACKAVYEK